MTLALALWHWTTRRLDLLFLWPACKRIAFERRNELPWNVKPPDYLEFARAAFAEHATHDAGWQWLGWDEMFRRIDELR